MAKKALCSEMVNGFYCGPPIVLPPSPIRFVPSLYLKELFVAKFFSIVEEMLEIHKEGFLALILTPLISMGSTIYVK